MLLHPLQTEWDADLRGGDPLAFPRYTPPAEESVVTGRTVAGYALVQGRFEVHGGSMGAAHGERVVRAYRRAAAEGLPVVVVATSGGARMQEGMISLIQMARTAAAASAHAAAGLLQVAVLRSPSTGGVLASYASLADLRAAEPGATIGFAGPRVVELTTGEVVGSDSHTAESAFASGLVDAVVARDDQAAWVEAALGLRDLPWTGEPPSDPAPRSAAVAVDVEGADNGGAAWAEVLRARSAERPTAAMWAARLCDSWVPLHSTDPCFVAGLATFEGRRVVVVAMHRARPGPAGFRLAQRAIALAGRLGLPLLTLVDTPGADPGRRAEAGGLAAEIARTFAALAATPSVTVALVTGEGGSGGALAVAATDRMLMLDHAVFSVISPEGAAAILDRTPDNAAVRAGHLKLTAADAVALGVADATVAEDEGAVRQALVAALDEASPGDRSRRLDAATAAWLR